MNTLKVSTKMLSNRQPVSVHKFCCSLGVLLVDLHQERKWLGHWIPMLSIQKPSSVNVCYTSHAQTNSNGGKQFHYSKNSAFSRNTFKGKICTNRQRRGIIILKIPVSLYHSPLQLGTSLWQSWIEKWQ